MGRRVNLAWVALSSLAAILPSIADAQVVSSWESSIANLKTPNASGQTVRQFARLSIGGPGLRIRFSNETGTEPLVIADAHVALPGSAAGSVDPTSDHSITFGGSTIARVPPGADLVSDPVAMAVQPLTRLAVSAFFRSATIVQVGHLLASETNYLAPGDHSADGTMAGATSVTSGFYLTGLSVEVGTIPSGTVACLGDSITDGLYSTTDAEHRYPDRLAERLLASSRGRVGAIDAGLVGNTLLGGTQFGLGGPSGVARLGEDVFRPGVRWLIVFEGINDIIYPPDSGDTAAELIASYEQIVAQSHEHAIKVFGATLTPFAGSGPAYYSDAKEAIRQTVNAWIRTSGAFDGVVDVDAAVRDPTNPHRLQPAYDGGDHLHLDDTGYLVIANTVPISFFY